MTERTCRLCNETKEEHLFTKDYRKGKNYGRYVNKCTSCTVKENTFYRHKRKDDYNQKAKTKRHERKLRAIEYKGGVCNDCKQVVHHCAFDFHHLDSSTKHKDPGLMMSHSDEELFKELDKCILLCSNCHRVRHFNEGY